MNTIIKGFSYGPSCTNKPPQILQSYLDNGKIMLSSSEMLTFIKNILLIIDFNIPEDDEHWELLVLLKIIVDYTTASYIHNKTHKCLQEVIVDYLKLLSQLFPNSLKPKHHHLLHYALCMKSCGPLWRFSCMRCESKHQESKFHVILSVE